MRSCRTPLAGVLATLFLAVHSGCGSKSEFPATVPVSGKVTYKGQPVAKGTVTFQPEGGQPATGALQPDGTFTLSTFAERDGALPGHHKVMIIANDSDPTLMPGSSPGYKPPKDLVPKKYAKLDTSGLSADVAKGNPPFEFDLK